tara:strand:- start:16238 stop:17380 length:1143 start_codon:yes stop_codon:yes gene_type:complete
MTKDNTKYIPLANPIIHKKVKEYVCKAIDNKALSGTYGIYINLFEKQFANYIGAEFAVSTTNGTNALHTALVALNIGIGDEVLVQSLTNMATAFAVSYTGAKVIPVDSDIKTGNINPNLIDSMVNIKTKAILVVHLFGHPVDMDAVLSVANKHNLLVIEDCAEAHGAKYKGRHLGTLGDIGCYSFYANKILSTGEGGMVVTNDHNLAKECNSIKNLRYGSINKFNHAKIGFNYRMSNLTAAIGCAQLENIAKVIEKKRYVASRYNSLLKDLKYLTLPIEQNYAYSVYWVYHVVCTNSLIGKRNKLMNALTKRKIETRESFWPINRQKAYKDEIAGKENFDCPIANFIGENGFYIPSGPDITDDEINRVSNAIYSSIEEVN